MYLVKTTDKENLEKIAHDIGAISDFAHLDLRELNTLELLERSDGASNGWMHTPYFMDEEGGLIIAEFRQEGLIWMIENKVMLAQYGIDFNQVHAFMADPRIVPIYCIDFF